MSETVKCVLWTLDVPDHEGQQAAVEVASEDPNEVSIHTTIDGRGSNLSLVLDREGAVELALALLQKSRL